MNTVPMGNTSNVKAFMAPVVTAASASWPKRLAMAASVKPTTTCELREMTMGHASASKAINVGRVRTVSVMGALLAR